MKLLKYSAIAVSLLGFFMLGRLSVKPEVIEKEVRVNYWDMTTMTEDKVEVAANYFGNTLESKNEINKIYDNRRDEVEKLRHQIWQAGFQQGILEGYKNCR